MRRLLRARAGGRLRAVRSLLRVLELRPTPIGVSDLPRPRRTEAADLLLRIHITPCRIDRVSRIHDAPGLQGRLYNHFS